MSLKLKNLEKEDIFTVEKNYGSRANSPKLARGKGKMGQFRINPSKIKKSIDTKYERKGEIHPQLSKLISSEFGEREQIQEQQQLSPRSKGFEYDQNDDGKMAVQDQMTENYNNVETFSLSAKVEQPPFKIIRKHPSVWTKKQTSQNSNSATANMESYYLHSALNRDPILSEKIKMQQQTLLKKIFKEIKIDSKMNEYCVENKIKNDYRSINIDKFIDNFINTYPYYLSMDGVK